MDFAYSDSSRNQIQQEGTALEGQYQLGRIFRIWAAATLPMIAIVWVIIPLLIPHVKQPPVILYWLMSLPGMLWQFILSLWIIRDEEGGLNWNGLHHRICLHLPRNPRTGEPQVRLFWRAIPNIFLTGIILGLGLFILPFSPYLIKLVGLKSPAAFLRMPSYTYALELASPEFSGKWWLLPLALITWILSAFLAEEFLFRGVLLPKMRGVFGKRDWLANAFLYGMHYLYLPWVIPFRFIVGLVVARSTRRFRSNWMAVIIRSVEGFGVLLIVGIGVRSSPLLPADLSNTTLPHIQREPGLANKYRGKLTRLEPIYDSHTRLWRLDLRGSNLSDLDFRNIAGDLMFSNFDSQTIWPPADRMPQNFAPNQILEIGKNPGLGIHQLHTKGINGMGVGIAIIDQPLLTDHQEYLDQLMWYEEIAVSAGEVSSLHGPALASIAVGDTIGVAPGADLYYIGVGEASLITQQYLHYFARGIRRIIQINDQLPADHKIRIISLSQAWLPESAGYYDMLAAVEQAKEKGIFVVCLNMEQVYSFKFEGLGREPLVDPDDFTSYKPSIFWADQFYEGGWASGALFFPMESRTIAGSSGADEYEFSRLGGWSWISPYLAGLYALAAQVDPAITPEEFWSIAVDTGRYIEIEHAENIFTLGPIIDPVAVVEALQ